MTSFQTQHHIPYPTGAGAEFKSLDIRGTQELLTPDRERPKVDQELAADDSVALIKAMSFPHLLHLVLLVRHSKPNAGLCNEKKSNPPQLK